MTQNAEVPPEQEINYLRQFTQGEARKLVDSYRKRQHNDPNVLLSQLWKELEKRFGNTALIASTLMKKLLKTAKFVEKENKKLQDFADVCSELDSQLESLPGLACLNYPNAISPVLEKLPLSLRSKWEKEVAKHAEENHNAYPGFHKFTIIVQRQATLRNHPNILASLSYASKDSKYKDENNQTSAFDPEAKVLKTRTHPPNDQPEDDEEVIKKDMESKCPFHDKKGHDVTTCKTFARKTLSARMEWIKRSRLCFRCFSPDHQASTCKLVIKCNKCGSTRHQGVLHVEKRKEDESKGEEKVGEEVASKCTSICTSRKVRRTIVCKNSLTGHLPRERATTFPKSLRNHRRPKQCVYDFPRIGEQTWSKGVTITVLAINLQCGKGNQAWSPCHGPQCEINSR
jgi:hypothetical protein